MVKLMNIINELRLIPGIPNTITPSNIKELIGKIRGDITLIENNIDHVNFSYKLNIIILLKKYHLSYDNYKRMEQELNYIASIDLRTLYIDLFKLYHEVNNYVSKQPK